MKRIGAVFLLFLFLLTGCSTPSALDPAPYAAHPFDTSYIAYLGQPSEEVKEILEESGTWKHLWNEPGEINPVPYREEPVEVLGDEYTLFVRICPPLDMYATESMYAFECFRMIESADDEEKEREVRELYQTMKDVLGEPAEMIYANSLEKERYGNSTYEATWVLDEGIHMAENPEPEMTLCCRMRGTFYPESASITVSYTLYPTDEIDWLVGYPGAEGKINWNQ